MKQFTLGSLVAAVVLFVWGAIFWANPFTYSLLPRAKDQAQLGALLREQLPESGTYLLPHPSGSQEEMNKLSLAGPIATIYFQREGGPGMDPRSFAFGFLHGWLVVLLIGILMTIALPALATYCSRVRFAVILGILVGLFTHVGSIIWWHYPRTLPLLNALYELGGSLLIGLVLAAFIKPARASAR